GAGPHHGGGLSGLDPGRHYGGGLSGPVPACGWGRGTWGLPRPAGALLEPSGLRGAPVGRGALAGRAAPVGAAAPAGPAGVLGRTLGPQWDPMAQPGPGLGSGTPWPSPDPGWALDGPSRTTPWRPQALTRRGSSPGA